MESTTAFRMLEGTRPAAVRSAELDWVPLANGPTRDKRGKRVARALTLQIGKENLPGRISVESGLLGRGGLRSRLGQADKDDGTAGGLKIPPCGEGLAASKEIAPFPPLATSAIPTA